MFQYTCSDRKQFVRHLLRELRKNGDDVTSRLSEKNKELMMTQMRFQCRICGFRSDVSAQLFLEHLASKEHEEACKSLLGPLWCVRCEFKCDTAQAMVEHFSEEAHRNAMEKGSQTFIVKESRSAVKCRECSKVFNHVTKLHQHIQFAHRSKDKLACKVAGCTFRARTQHERYIHSQKHCYGKHRFECTVCILRTESQDRLDTHNRSSRHKKLVEDQLQPHLMTRCGSCGRFFTNSEYFFSPSTSPSIRRSSSFPSLRCLFWW